MTGFSTVGKIIGVAILLALSAYVLYFVWRFLTDPDTLNRLLRLGVELIALFVFWMLTFGRMKKK